MTRLQMGTATVDAAFEALDRDGFVIIEGALTAEEVAAKKAELHRILEVTPSGRNNFEGFETRRVYALFAKTRAFDEPATVPVVLGVLDRVLGNYVLSAPQAIQIGPGESRQALHRDDVVYPLARPHQELVVNTMWAIDDFTEENGATHVIPGSHRWAPERTPEQEHPTMRATMPAGSVMIFLGDVFHGGGANATDRPRLGVILEYCVGWIRQQENQYLAVPRDVVRTLPERLQRLLGYDVWPDFLGVVDARHPLKALAKEA
ncbi:MAG: phytanoyl-CoA dioxygenase family protein [Dehalococcoidia bacterium]